MLLYFHPNNSLQSHKEDKNTTRKKEEIKNLAK